MADKKFFIYNNNVWNLDNIVGVSEKSNGSFVVLVVTGADFEIDPGEGQALLRHLKGY